MKRIVSLSYFFNNSLEFYEVFYGTKKIEVKLEVERLGKTKFFLKPKFIIISP